MEILKELVFLGGSVFIFSMAWFHFEEKERVEKIKRELKKWWEESSDEKDFKDKVNLFLEEYPFPRSEKQQKKLKKNLDEIQVLLRKEFLREEKISFEVYEELYYEIEEKRGEISFN